MEGEKLARTLRSHVQSARGVLNGEDAPWPWTVLDVETEGLHGPLRLTGTRDVQNGRTILTHPPAPILDEGTIITHGGSYDYHYVDPPSENILLLDTEPLYHLLDENRSTSLKELAPRYLPSVSEKWAEGWRSDMTGSELQEYLGLDLQYTEELLVEGWDKLDDDRKREWLLVECPMELIIADAEKRGILVDVPQLLFIHEETAVAVAEMERELVDRIPDEVRVCKKCEGTGVYRWRGVNWKPETPDRENPCTDCEATGWNPKALTSDDVLRELLFDYWRLSPMGTTKTGLPSTREEDLEALVLKYGGKTVAATFIERYLEYRHLIKRLQFTTDWIERLGSGDTLHPSFGLCNTVTARLTCSNPNMQQVPPELRRVFIPRPGFKFVNVDFSTIEFYLIGYLTNEFLIINAYENGEDVHQQTADIAGVSRSQGKTINFSLVYGVSDYTLAKRLGISKQEAKELRGKVMGGYEKLARGMQLMIQRCRRDGYIGSIGARRRHLPNIVSDDPKLRARAERQCINFTAQYGAAYLCKLALVNTALNVPDARLILQVHDSGLYEVPAGEAGRVASEIEYAWRTCHRKLKPRVDVKILERWE